MDEWRLAGAVKYLSIVDINADEEEEIVVVTDQGHFHYLDKENYNTLWSNAVDEYERLTTLLIHNIDQDVPRVTSIVAFLQTIVKYEKLPPLQAGGFSTGKFASARHFIGPSSPAILNSAQTPHQPSPLPRPTPQ